MACQRIVLGSHVSGITDILANFQDCMFEPNDIDQLIKKIRTFKKMSIELRASLSKAMRKEVEHSFNMDLCIFRYEKLYKNMIKH